MAPPGVHFGASGEQKKRQTQEEKQEVEQSKRKRKSKSTQKSKRNSKSKSNSKGKGKTKSKRQSTSKRRATSQGQKAARPQGPGGMSGALRIQHHAGILGVRTHRFLCWKTPPLPLPGALSQSLSSPPPQALVAPLAA